MSDDAIENTLEAIGATPVDVDEARLDRIQRQLDERIGPAADRKHGAAVVVMSPRRRRRTGWLGVAAASVLVLVVLAFGVIMSGDDAMVIAAADDVDVTLPDGELVDGQPGLELPDGARLDVDGFVVIDGERFGPGSYLVVGTDLVPDLTDAENVVRSDDRPVLDEAPPVAATTTTEPAVAPDEPTQPGDRIDPTPTTAPRSSPESDVDNSARPVRTDPPSPTRPTTPDTTEPVVRPPPPAIDRPATTDTERATDDTRPAPSTTAAPIPPSTTAAPRRPVPTTDPPLRPPPTTDPPTPRPPSTQPER